MSYLPLPGVESLLSTALPYFQVRHSIVPTPTHRDKRKAVNL